MAMSTKTAIIVAETQNIGLRRIARQASEVEGALLARVAALERSAPVLRRWRLQSWLILGSSRP